MPGVACFQTRIGKHSYQMRTQALRMMQVRRMISQQVKHGDIIAYSFYLLIISIDLYTTNNRFKLK